MLLKMKMIKIFISIRPKKINLKKIKEKELSNPFIKLKDLKIIS